MLSRMVTCLPEEMVLQPATAALEVEAPTRKLQVFVVTPSVEEELEEPPEPPRVFS